MPSDVDQEYAARQQQASDAADGRALLAAHPELLKMVRPEAETATQGDQKPGTGDVAGPPDSAKPLMTPQERILRATQGPEGLQSVIGDIAEQFKRFPQTLSDTVAQFKPKAGTLSPITPTDAQNAMGLHIALATGGGIKDEGGGGIVGPDGQPVSSAEGAAQEGGAAQGTGAEAAPAEPSATEAAPATPTPEAAAQTAASNLAQKQLDNLKAVRVGKTTATEFGRPDIATTVPERLTMEESQALKQHIEGYYSQSGERPVLAAHTQALASAYQEENDAIYALNRQIRAKLDAGEDATGDKQELVHRFSAFAANYSTLAGAQSETGRALQILSPNKPGNAFVQDTARIAQELSEPGNAEKLSDFLSRTEQAAINRAGAADEPLVTSTGETTALPKPPKAAQSSTDIAALTKSVQPPLAKRLTPEQQAALPPSADAFATLARASRQMVEDIGMGRKVYDAFNEYWVNNLLSNAGRTTGRIGTSNAMNAILTLPAHQLASFIPGSPIKMGEPAAGVEGFFRGFWHSLDVGLESAKTLRPESQIEGGSIDPDTWTPKQAISAQAFGLQDDTGFKGGVGTALDYAGSILRLGNRAIMGVHQFGHASATAMSGHMLAWRDAVNQAAEEGVSGMEGYNRANEIYHATINDMPADMRLLASKQGDVMTFVNQLEKGSPADLAQQLTQFPVIHQLMPFFRIGYNVTKAGADMTPGIGQLTNLPDLIAGSPAERYMAMGKMAWGGVMGAAIVHEFHQGNLVLDKYGKPYAKVGDYQVSFPPPLDFPIAAIGNYIANTGKMDDPTVLSDIGAYAKALGTATADNTIVQGLVNLKRLWTDVQSGDPSALEKYTGDLASPIIPFSALMGATARGIDDTQRDPKTFGQELQSTLPIIREGVPKKVDIFNKPSPSPTLGLPDSLIFPVNVNDVEKDPVKQMIAETGAKFAFTPNVLFGRKQAPGMSANHPDIGVVLDGGNPYGPEHDMWNEERARGLYERLDNYRQGAYLNDSPDRRKAEIESIGHEHADDANWAMLRNPDIAKRYGERVARKAGVNVPSDIAPPPMASTGAPSTE